MSPEIQTLLTTIVFLSQIAVMSFIAPLRLRRFCKQQYDAHPETEYPRWYPVPRAELERLLKRHVVARMVVGLIGLAALVCGIISAAPPLLLSFLLVFLLVFQIWSGKLAWLPGMGRALRVLREMPPPARRSAELHRWRITDFVSPVVIGLGFASQMSVVATVLYVYLERRSIESGLFILVLFVASWILARMVYRILRPVSPVREDPYMSDTDLRQLRQRGLQAQFARATTQGIIISFMLLMVARIIGLDFVWFCLAFSLWLQTRSLSSPGRSLTVPPLAGLSRLSRVLALLVFLAVVPAAAFAQSAQEQSVRKPGDVVVELVSLETMLGKIDYEVGTIFVPENRSDPHSRVIGVGFARFRAAEPTGAPPTFHLPGGPGESFLRTLKRGNPLLPGELRYIRLFRSIGADVVFVDQRGSSERGEILSVKVSTPARSPDKPLAFGDFVDATREAARTAVAESKAANIDLRGYTVLECADDVDDLRRALGYDRISLVGLSFGSQWSLAVMRRHPDAVARALLTGVEPLDRESDMPSEVYAALQRMWFEAEQQPDLRPYVPPGGLTEVASDILNRLEREPVRVTVKQNDGEEVTVTLGPFDLQRDFLRLAQQPDRLLELRHGQYDSWAREVAARAVSREIDFELLNPLVNASLGSTPERIALLRGDPAARFLGRLGFDLNLETADVWPVPDVGDEFRKPVETRTPVVFVQGDWDTSTPVENTLALAPYFPNSRVLIVHRGGHGGVMPVAAYHPPVMQQLLAFLETGKTDDLPVEITMPARRFALPGFPPPAVPK